MAMLGGCSGRYGLSSQLYCKERLLQPSHTSAPCQLTCAQCQRGRQGVMRMEWNRGYATPANTAHKPRRTGTVFVGMGTVLHCRGPLVLVWRAERVVVGEK